MKKGCIVGLIILALIIVGLGLLWMNRGKILNFAVNKGVEMVEDAIVQNLPTSVSQDSVHALFQNTLEKIKNSEIDAEDLQDLMTTFQAGMADKKLDSLEVSNILEGLKKINE